MLCYAGVLQAKTICGTHKNKDLHVSHSCSRSDGLLVDLLYGKLMKRIIGTLSVPNFAI